MTAIGTEIQVLRRIRDGYYIYTSEALPGLYVACSEDQRAYEDVPVAIRMLFKLDFGVEVSVHHKADYSTFMARIEMGKRARAAVEDRTDHLMNSHQNLLSFLIGSSNDDRAAGSH